jgi:hypothetical protein
MVVGIVLCHLISFRPVPLPFACMRCDPQSFPSPDTGTCRLWGRYLLSSTLLPLLVVLILYVVVGTLFFSPSFSPDYCFCDTPQPLWNFVWTCTSPATGWQVRVHASLVVRTGVFLVNWLGSWTSSQSNRQLVLSTTSTAHLGAAVGGVGLLTHIPKVADMSERQNYHECWVATRIHNFLKIDIILVKSSKTVCW